MCARMRFAVCFLALHRADERYAAGARVPVGAVWERVWVPCGCRVGARLAALLSGQGGRCLVDSSKQHAVMCIQQLVGL